MNLPSNAQQSNHNHATWWCRVVDVTRDGDERFDPDDTRVNRWLSEELGTRLTADYPIDEGIGEKAYHLKGRGGIKQAIQDLQDLLATEEYPYVILSDAKGYYAHIRHHKLIGRTERGVDFCGVQYTPAPTEDLSVRAHAISPSSVSQNRLAEKNFPLNYIMRFMSREC